MKKIIRLTESDLMRLVRRVINEQGVIDGGGNVVRTKTNNLPVKTNNIPRNQSTDNVIGEKINLYTDSINKKMLGQFKIKKVSGEINNKTPYIFINLNDDNNKEHRIYFTCLNNNIGFKILHRTLLPLTTVYSTPLEDNLKNGYCKTLTSTSTNSGSAAPSVSTNPTKTDFKNDYQNFKFPLLNNNKKSIGEYKIIDGYMRNGEVKIVIQNNIPDKGKYQINFSCLNKKSGFQLEQINQPNFNIGDISTVYSVKLEARLNRDFCMMNKSGEQVPKADFASTSTNNSQNYTNNSQNYVS